MLTKRLSRRAIAMLCALWLAAMLLPLAAMCFLDRPVHDDFPHMMPAVEAYARTGSLQTAFGAAWERMTTMYNTWQGTFAAMLYSAFQPMLLSPRLFFLAPLCMLAALCLSAAYACRALLRRLSATDRVRELALTTVFLTYLTQFMPGMREAIYWQSGAPYTLSVVALLLMLGLMCKLDRPHNAVLGLWRCFAAFLCGVVLGGCPYPLALGGAVAFGLIALWRLIRRAPSRWGALSAFLGVAVALVIVVLAPGNSVRQNRVGAPIGAVSAILHAIAEAAQVSGEWIGPQVIALLVLLVPMLWQPLAESKARFRLPLLFTLLSFGVLAAAFVPPIYATGIEGYKAERILASLFMLFAALLLINVVYWTGWAAQKRPELFAKPLPIWRLLLCLGLLVWGLFSVAILRTPTVSAVYAFANGDARAYDTAMTAREQACAAAETNDEAIAALSPLPANPAVLPLDMAPNQTKGDFPWLMHRYYRITQLVSEYGAGNIPADEWSKLELPPEIR